VISIRVEVGKSKYKDPRKILIFSRIIFSWRYVIAEESRNLNLTRFFKAWIIVLYILTFCPSLSNLSVPESLPNSGNTSTSTF